MAKHAPAVMISSTFYDLRQIRQDLVSFLEMELGYNALFSEFDSFPIGPDTDTIDNCRRRVEKDADILVLIIGGRYGYVDSKSNKSVTNLEYLTARAKGIPVYAFVDKSVLTLLPIWERNPKAKFGSAVPDTKVFEFIRQVRSIDKVWTYEFEHAQTIIQTLRLQFAHLISEGLRMTKQLALEREIIPVDISGKALRILLEKSSYWEPYLFAGSEMIDQFNKIRFSAQKSKIQLTFTLEVNLSSNVDFGDLVEECLKNCDKNEES